MRTFRALTIVMAFAAMSAVALAQVPEGPLVDPAVTPAPAKPVKSKLVKKLHKKASAVASTKTGAVPSDSVPTKAAAVPGSVPSSRADHHGTTTTDPVSFGMKWNGNNDTAEKTRVQNYGGDAAGTGAAVGLKLHF